MDEAEVVAGVPAGASELTQLLVQFPTLIVDQVSPSLVLSGDFELEHEGVVFDTYKLRIEVGDFPKSEPKVYELEGRVKVGQHRNPDGTCCTGVFEVWRAQHPSGSLIDFIKGPVRNYFLGHHAFVKTGAWPFGELDHGLRGLIQAAAELLGIGASERKVLGYLHFLSRSRNQRFRRCPCGSGKPTATCHGSNLRKLGKEISAPVAKSVLQRILYYKKIERESRILGKLIEKIKVLQKELASRTHGQAN